MSAASQTSRTPRGRATWSKRRAATASPPPPLPPEAPLLTVLPCPKPLRAHLLDESGVKRADAVKKIASRLSESGFCVCRGGVDASLVAEARSEVAALFKHGAMRPGGFTIAGRDDVVKAARDDHTMWLHEFLNKVGNLERAF